ncbi:MAG TPA: GtrA family protein [Clostridiales bacterium]|nr:GtrA family protein [Clostridiales bacterium]
MSEETKSGLPETEETEYSAEPTSLEKDANKKTELKRAIKFVLFSASAGLIQLGSYTILDLATPWPWAPCYLIALVLSVLWNFTFNRKFTFKSANNIPIAMLKVFAYYCVFTPATLFLGACLSDGKLDGTVQFFNDPVGIPGILTTIINMLINLVTEFLYQRFFVFRDSIDTNSVAEKEELEKEENESVKATEAAEQSVSASK